VHAVVLSGGSAFGLAAADGVMRYLAEAGIGYRFGGTVVPIVPAAVIFDLEVAGPGLRPWADFGYRACGAATADRVASGNHGVGAGCSAGKIAGPGQATRSALGSAAMRGRDGLLVSALVAANPLGDIIDSTGHILAGARRPDGRGYLGCSAWLASGAESAPSEGNTVIGVIATNAKLDKETANNVALMAHDGVARAVRPAHTPFDGDTLFALATGEVDASLLDVGVLAAESVRAAIVRAAVSAQSAPGLPAGFDASFRAGRRENC
jgi:L-aminopeptidase/D-esterase-like protein